MFQCSRSCLAKHFFKFVSLVATILFFLKSTQSQCMKIFCVDSVLLRVLRQKATSPLFKDSEGSTIADITFITNYLSWGHFYGLYCCSNNTICSYDNMLRKYSYLKIGVRANKKTRAIGGSWGIKNESTTIKTELKTLDLMSQTTENSFKKNKENMVYLVCS